MAHRTVAPAQIDDISKGKRMVSSELRNWKLNLVMCDESTDEQNTDVIAEIDIQKGRFREEVSERNVQIRKTVQKIKMEVMRRRILIL